MNTILFKSIIVLNEDTITSLAQKLGITRQTLALKIEGYNDFKQSEICAISRLYNLNQQQIYDIFFKECKCIECA